MSDTDHHASQPKTYYIVFGLLLVLLALTIIAAQIENPVLNLAAALLIATSKAVLIVLFFMHVRDSTPLTQVTALAGFVWLLILLLFLLSDYVTRV